MPPVQCQAQDGVQWHGTPESTSRLTPKRCALPVCVPVSRGTCTLPCLEAACPHPALSACTWPLSRPIFPLVRLIHPWDSRADSCVPEKPSKLQVPGAAFLFLQAERRFELSLAQGLSHFLASAQCPPSSWRPPKLPAALFFPHPTHRAKNF